MGKYRLQKIDSEEIIVELPSKAKISTKGAIIEIKSGTTVLGAFNTESGLLLVQEEVFEGEAEDEGGGGTLPPPPGR